MNTNDIIRAWKDDEFRSTLDADQLARLPLNPIGAVELSDADLGAVSGGAKTVGTVCEAASISMCSAQCSSWSCFPRDC